MLSAPNAAKSSRRVRPDWRAMAMSPRKGGLDPDQLRALRMIAESHFGCTQSVLLAHGLESIPPVTLSITHNLSPDDGA
jgi:hypothetical protein